MASLDAEIRKRSDSIAAKLTLDPTNKHKLHNYLLQLGLTVYKLKKYTKFLASQAKGVTGGGDDELKAVSKVIGVVSNLPDT